ncbi:MAG TPA: transcriptional regulator [Thermoanaerobaculia bacterium]|nr:transcriptional regulator [Thermoanaerobaculia bacterium]
MTEGDVALTPLPQADGRTKPRPAILLRRMPPFGDWLICGVSTQLHQQVVGFDEVIEPSHPDFSESGLKAASLIRLGFLTVLPADHFLGVLGSVSRERHAGLLRRLSVYLADERRA